MCLNILIWLRERGAHEITDETVFPSLPGFVFHDSCGIEAGSFDEVVEIECFVKNRSLLVKNKHKQLHAIWICLPLDTDRPLLQAEKSLCRLNSGDVPIIAIFTKYDARYTKFLAELINCAPVPGRAAMRKVKADANERAGRRVDDLRRTLDSDEECSHPSAYMTAPDLQEASVDNETFCQALMLNTQNLLPSSKMQALLVTVWRNNVSERSVWLFHCILNENNGLFPTGEITKKAVAELVAIFLPATHGNPVSRLARHAYHVGTEY
ncbi:hypothetical protein OF83DRAFT_558280 [Amylostereum chailletii]|nr:hypothetical protein OF83DRAFT_558280 [Amylostereum chailletii]